MTKSILDIKLAKNERIYALGDIHGCYDELLALEKKITDSVGRSKFSKYRIVSVGDLCDRGPNANAVMEHFVKGSLAGTHQLILGNHEIFFMLAFIGLRPDLLEKARVPYSWFHRALVQMFPPLQTSVDNWRVGGGEIVFKSYSASIDDIKTWDKVPASHLRLLFEAPLVIRTPKVIISHALIHEGDIEKFVQSDEDALSNTENIVDKEAKQAVFRSVWERNQPETRIDALRRHISGHTPMKMVYRDVKHGTVQIDTGAVYGQKLTAIDLRSFRVISVPSGYNCKAAAKAAELLSKKN
jgi:serine/threonine protein phosphatase 1